MRNQARFTDFGGITQILRRLASVGGCSPEAISPPEEDRCNAEKCQMLWHLPRQV